MSDTTNKTTDKKQKPLSQTARQGKKIAALEEKFNGVDKKIDGLIDVVESLADAVLPKNDGAEHTDEDSKDIELDASDSGTAAHVQDKAKNHIHVTSRTTDASEQDLGGVTGDAEFEDKPGEQTIIQDVDADLNDPWLKRHMDDMQFNEEKLEVHIQETADEKADQIFEIMVNGESEVFKRGENKIVARKFVEGLARAKPVHYKNEEFVGKDGLKHVRYPSHKGLRYGFAIVNPKKIDEAWLQHILRQP